MDHEIKRRVKCKCGEKVMSYGVQGKDPEYILTCNWCKEKYTVLSAEKTTVELNKIKSVEVLKIGITT